MNSSLLIIGNKKSPQIKRISSELSGYEILIEEDSSKIINAINGNRIIRCILYFISNKVSEDIKAIKNITTLINIPIIALAEYLDDDSQVELLSLNVDDFIPDFVSTKVIQGKIANAIKHNQTISFMRELEIDDLTGLYTRQAFLQKARAYIDIDPEADYVLIATDFPSFKYANIQFGEEKCDEFLASIGKKLAVVNTNCVTGRYGGDQFVALIRYNWEIHLEDIQKSVEETVANSPLPHLKVKVGVYKLEDKSIPILACCDRAFLAIKQIKGIYNKDIILYEDSFTSQIDEEQKIIDTMETALQEKQFMVYYQPKHESVTGNIAGCEALVRWNHPEYGFMNPGRFIPLFEKNGFITKLDSFIVQRVCENINTWKANNIPVVPISINISRRDYLEPNWMNNQIAVIDSYGIDHSLIHFEVTESMYSEYTDLIIEQVRQVQMQNFLIEMDDFGSGYSSLGLLSTFPLNVIKLDISFVRNIETNEIVIENIIKMAHKMGLSVVAEGAETEEQFKILKALGCDLIQGYCFSKPLSQSDFEQYLLKNKISNTTEYVSTLPPMKSESLQSYDSEILVKAATEIGDSIPGGFITYHADENREIITFNKEILKLFDCETSEEFRAYTNNSFDSLVHPEDYDRVVKEINAQITETNNLDHVKYRVISKTGKIKYVDDYGRLVHTYKYGNVFYVFINDITDIHEKHMEVQRYNEVIQGLSRSYSSIYLIDFESNLLVPYAMDDANLALMGPILNSGLYYDEIVEYFADTYVVKNEREKIKVFSTRESMQEQFKETDFYNFTFHYINEGTVKLMELSLRQLKDENKGLRAVLAFREVTESMIDASLDRNQDLVKELEEHKEREKEDAIKLEKAYEAAEAAKNARGILLTKFAEDIKKPLSDIRDSSKIAMETDSIEDIKKSISKVSDSSERILRIINNIQLGAKVGTDESATLNYIPTDCSKAAEKLLLIVSDAAEKKNIKIESSTSIINPMIYQDLDKTSQITISILENAIKYTPVNGKVSFELNQIPGEKPDECYMVFICRDNGIGISEEFMPRIYDVFSREKNDVNHQDPSSGLGLYIAKTLLKYLNGTIEVKSQQGKGTEVIVTMPHKYVQNGTAKEV